MSNVLAHTIYHLTGSVPRGLGRVIVRSRVEFVSYSYEHAKL